MTTTLATTPAPAPRRSGLVDRYVHAVTRRVPADQRADIERELRSTIADAVDAELDGGRTDAATAERLVLERLGDPRALAAGYGAPSRALVGPDRYDDWRQVLRVALAVAVPALALLRALGPALDDDGAAAVAGAAIAGALWGAVQAAFWVTLAFAVLERTAPATTWDLDALPDPPATTPRPPTLADAALDVALAVAVVGALAWQHLRSPLRDDTGERIPLLQASLWGGWMWVVLALVVASTAIVVVAHLAGGWRWPTALANVAANAGLLAVIGALAAADRLVEPAFLAELADRAGWDRTPEANATLITGLLALIVVWDSAECLLGARRSASSGPAGA